MCKTKNPDTYGTWTQLNFVLLSILYSKVKYSK